MSDSKRSMEPPIVGKSPSKRKCRQHRIQKLFTVVGVLALTAPAYLIVARAVRPVFMVHSENTEISTLSQQLNSERLRNQQLRTRISFLKTTEGVQTEARKYGWVQKGEISYRLYDPPASPQTQKDSKGITGNIKGWLSRH